MLQICCKSSGNQIAHPGTLPPTLPPPLLAFHHLIHTQVQKKTLAYQLFQTSPNLFCGCLVMDWVTCVDEPMWLQPLFLIGNHCAHCPHSFDHCAQRVCRSCLLRRRLGSFLLIAVVVNLAFCAWMFQLRLGVACDICQ